MMELGRLRHAVEIQLNTPTVGADNSETPAWATIATRKAEILPASAKELLEARSQGVTFTHMVAMHYYSGLTPKHRLRTTSGRILNIESVLNADEHSKVHELICKEVEV